MLTSPCACELQPDRDRVIVRLTGELDLAGAAGVRATLDELLEVGFTRLVVDLRDLSFMDSTGLRTLLEVHRALQDRGGRLSLVCGPGPVRRLLEVTATDTIFAIDDPKSVR